ncbi:hypothetical protein [Okeania sp. KiyG1]|uniref:hypothetical protein n=1 Tax=Okeania sp. KiyG1 TaxID=2720165 RepID=UPI00192457A9|nr:hypothetical protein [Okeania sp. KiyG1]
MLGKLNIKNREQGIVGKTFPCLKITIAISPNCSGYCYISNQYFEVLVYLIWQSPL